MKKIAFIILAMLLPILANGATTTFQVNGISYETLEEDNQAVKVISGSTKYSGDIVIPPSVTYGGKTYQVKKIGQGAFWECTGLKSIVLPEGLVEIENSSFTGCTGLKALTIPSSVVSIDGTVWSSEMGAFEGCTGLKSIYFPSAMKVSQLYDANIGGKAFYGCTGLKTIYVAGNETVIAMYDVFGGCTAVTDFVSCIENPKAVYVDARSFQGFTETANLIVPNGKKNDYLDSNDWYLFKHIYERSSYTKAFAIVTASQGGKVSYSNENVTIGTQVWGINNGQNAMFTITPDENHRLLKLLKDGQDVTSSVSNGQYTVSNVQSDFMLEAFFEEGTTPAPQPQPQDKGTAKLSIESFDIKAGETKTMLIDMQNPDDQVTLVQFDLRLPDGLSIATGNDATDIAGRTTWRKHTLTSSATNGITRFLLYSATNELIEGTSGAIISIKLTASSSFNGGDIKLENQLMTTPSLVESKPATYTYNIKGGEVTPPAGDAEPYVVYSNGTLTFYCDSKRSSRQGTTYDMNTDRNAPLWQENSQSIEKVVFDNSFAKALPTTTYSWFEKCVNLSEIEGIENLNTSEVVYTSAMFLDCFSLTRIDLSHFNTSKVKLMHWMFSGCRQLTTLDLSTFDTSETRNMAEMFSSCTKLEEINLCSFNTRKVALVAGMFGNCSSLKEIDISNFDTSALQYNGLEALFRNCTSLTNIILGKNFASSEELDCNLVFDGCTVLNRITFTGDIPSSINSKFFEGVGTANAPATLEVPEQYRDHYAAKFDGNKFFGGYFKLSGDTPAQAPVEMTFQVLNAVDGIVYSNSPITRVSWKKADDMDFKGYIWTSCSKQLDNGEWSLCGLSSFDITTWKSGSQRQGYGIYEDGFYKLEWGYQYKNGDEISLGSLIVEVRDHDIYTAIWLDENSHVKSFCDINDLDFRHTEGLKAYIATGFNAVTGEVKMQQVDDAPSGTGLLVAGQPGCYLAERTTSSSKYDSNMLVGVCGQDKGYRKLEPLEDGFANYIFEEGTQQFTFAGNLSYTYVSNNQAYLRIPASEAGDIQTIIPVFSESTVTGEPYAVFNDFTLTFYCDDQRSKRSGTIYSLNDGEAEPEWVLDDNNRNVQKVVFDASFAKARPTSTFQWFFYCDYLTEIKGIENLNTSEVKTMRAMFGFCKRLKSVDVSHFDTKAVLNMGAMFSFCTSLESIDVSHFDSNNVWSMVSMFNNCQSLTEINLSSFNTSNVEYLSYLFTGCSNLKTVYFGSGFVSDNSVECEETFADCPNLSKVVFTGDIPASINSTLFEGVGTASTPVKLDVPEQYVANYEARFNGNMFYGGYFTLREAIVPDEKGGKDYGSGNSEIDDKTNLDGSVIGNVYYSIAPENGGYNSAEGCLVVTQPSSDNAFDSDDPFGDDFKGMFTGIILMVQQGSGIVKVEAETSGGMTLMVKVGNGLPIQMTMLSKSTLAIPYSVDRPTYIYIYAGGSNGNARTRANSDDALKIYSISWESSASDISTPIGKEQLYDVYSLSGTLIKRRATSLDALPKGVYIVNGRKVVVK